tara:strand:+ start:1797 stop:2486 length:690 start_codon:yes stop_codon:yes gene_type:complete
MKILLIKDDQIIREKAYKDLISLGIEVNLCSSEDEASQIISNYIDGFYALIIIDLTLRKLGGIELCSKIRVKNKMTPIIILSNKESEDEIILGLEIGADDYMRAPFSNRELIARCKALIRRGKFNSNLLTEEKLNYQDLCLYEKEFRISKNQKDLNLSPKEYKILRFLMINPKKVWSREIILESIWGINSGVDIKTIDVHIRWIRKKIEDDPSKPIYIKTVRGVGYKLG